MAVITARSTIVANTFASPPIQNPTVFENGRERCSVAVVGVTSGDSIGSVYKLARVFSWHRIRSIRMFNAAITSGAANFGLYRVDADGGAVVLANAYASAVSIASAQTTGTELAFSNRAISAMAQFIWQDAGLTADPHLPYDLCMTLTAAAAASGSVGFDIGFVID